MAFLLKDKGGTEIAPVPVGMHHAVCYGVVDIGTQPAFGKFGAKRKVIILFEIPSLRIEIPDKQDEKKKLNLPRVLSIKETATLSSKGNLRPILEGWRGRVFTEEELKGFDIHKVIGANALLNVIHEERDQKKYANISSVNPLAQGMQKIKSEQLPITFSLDDCKPGAEIHLPPVLPAWITGMIMQSDEYIKLSQNGSHVQRNDDPGHKTADDEEDVPF